MHVCVFFCLQSPCTCDAPAGLESCSSSRQHLTVEHDEQKLNSDRQNLFSIFQATSIDGTVPSDTQCLSLPKFEHKHTADSVDICDQEQTDVGFRDSDTVQSIMVKLPLIARLRHSKSETPVPCVNAEIADAEKDCCAVDKEDVKPATAADVEMTDETQADMKKETTAAAKAELARKTIANILGTKFEPPVMMKIPMKRRAERDTDERSNVKQSWTSSRNDDFHNHLSDRQCSRYVLEELHFDGIMLQSNIHISVAVVTAHI